MAKVYCQICKLEYINLYFNVYIYYIYIIHAVMILILILNVIAKQL